MRPLSVGVLFVTAIVLIAIPEPTGREGTPWRTELDTSYAESEYVVLDHGLYFVGPKDLTKSIGYISESTGLFKDRYVFMRCGLELRYLSVSDPADRELLETARFIGSRHRSYERYHNQYFEQCWSTVAIADRLHRYYRKMRKLIPEWPQL